MASLAEIGAGDCVLIAAQSGRALGMAARRAGLVPLVADLFGDADTRATASDLEVVAGTLRGGMSAAGLFAALERLAADAPREPIGLVLGSGFEDRPRLIARLQRRWRILGNAAEAVAAVKDPVQLATACEALGVPFPQVASEVPAGSGGWLIKRIGGSGGIHVHRATTAGPVARGCYAMEWRAGDPWSLGFVAYGAGARSIGFSRQWADPTKASPYRFGGIAGPLAPPAGVGETIERAADDLARHFGLVGLGSLDVLIDGEAWALCEINPRPGASLDVLDRGDLPLMLAHVRAAGCESATIGHGSAPALGKVPVRACEIVYARRKAVAVGSGGWPEYVFDRPIAGTTISRGAPIATVYADGTTYEEARAAVACRARDLRRRIGEISQ